MLGQHRSTQRKRPHGRADEERLTADIIELARQYGRYGYRRVAELLRRSGWHVNDKRPSRRRVACLPGSEATHFLMKRLKNVATEMALNVLGYNLTRVIAIMGVGDY
ncbi:MAG: hypothetical protein ACI89J_001551 [Hyphomicrobiaceae bacterium]